MPATLACLLLLACVTVTPPLPICGRPGSGRTPPRDVWARLVSRLAFAALVAAGSGCSLIETPPFPDRVGSRPPETLSDAEIDQRVAFISERLDAGQLHAAAWEYGWLTLNGGGGIAAATLAGTTHHRHKRVYYIIKAVKGAVGTTYLLADPLAGVHGADPIRALPAQTHEEKVEQLARAEALLWKAAQRAKQRTNWVFHVGNLIFNGIGGAVMLALHEPEQAALSGGLDAAIGELQLLSAPWEPVEDWDSYERFVASDGIAQAPPPRWRVIANGWSIAARLEF
jgi:hypothetical protein